MSRSLTSPHPTPDTGPMRRLRLQGCGRPSAVAGNQDGFAG
ncbi:hypothetical protein [Streptomyces sp. TE5632]